MRKILGCFVLLASALFVAGCGSSSSGNNNQDNSLLNGQFVFQEQVYTYFGSGTLAAPAQRQGGYGRAALPRPLTHVATLPRREQGLANLLALHGKARHSVPSALKNAVPQMGDNGSLVAWGAAVGSLTFDGNGNVTAGEIDFNEPTSFGYFTDPVNGSYSVDSNRVGTIYLTSTNGDGDTFNYQIALQGSGQATGAQLLEGESDGAGDVEIGSGQMLAQSAGQTQATLNGNYIFGVQGQTCYSCTQLVQGDLFAAGVLAADGAGNFGTNGEADIATGFYTDNQDGLTGAYTAPDASGRSTATLNATGYSHGALPGGYVIYAANSSTAFIMSTDQSATGAPAAYFFGEMNAQTGTLNDASLAGNYVLGETTEDLQNETVAAGTYSDALLGLLTATGGALNGTADLNQAGTISSGVAVNYGVYDVGPRGRVVFTGGASPSGAPAPVFYINGSGLGYGVDQLYGNASFQEPGLLYLFQQTGSSFSNSSLSGNYAMGNLNSAIGLVGLNGSLNEISPGLINGNLTADGNGNLTATNNSDAILVYINGDGFYGDLTGTYAVGANGRGTITGSSSDSNTLLASEVFYMSSTSMALAMDVEAGNSSPSIQVIQQ